MVIKNLCSLLLLCLFAFPQCHSSPLLIDPDYNQEDESSETIEITRMVNNKWPDGVLPYEIDCSFNTVVDSIYYIYNAMDVIENKTCLRFVPRKPKDKTYLWFTRNHGCFGRVGY